MYKPPSQSDKEFTNRLSSAIDYYSPKYENLILIGDFNLSIENQHLDALINFETGISDHHKLVSTILKSGSLKGTPKVKIYRS